MEAPGRARHRRRPRRRRPSHARDGGRAVRPAWLARADRRGFPPLGVGGPRLGEADRARRQPARFRVLAPARRWCRPGQNVPFMGYLILTADGTVLPPSFATRQDAFVYLALASALWT